LAQRKPVQIGQELKELMDKADACAKANGSDCATLYREIIRRGRDMDDHSFQDYLYYKLALFYYRTGLQDSAIYHLRIAKEIATNQNDTASLADVYNVLGTAHYELGKVDSAIYCFIESSKRLEMMGDSVYLAYTLANIGLTLGEVLNNEESLKYLLQAYDILKALNAGGFTNVVMANISLAHYHLGDMESARTWALETIEFMGDELASEAAVIAYYTLAMAHLEDVTAAQSYAQKAVDIAISNNIRSKTAADAMDVYAGVLMATGAHSEALKLATQAISIHREWMNPMGLSRSLRHAAKASMHVGAYESSAAYWEEYAQIQDTLLSESGRKLINELNVQYETEKKEKALAEGKLLIANQQARIRLILILGMGLLLLGLSLWWGWQRNQKLKLAAIQKEKEIEILKAWVMGEEQERNRVSKELHDGVASLIAAALANLRVIHQLPPEKIVLQQAKLEGILEKTHFETRRIAHNLLPLTLENEGLMAAVAEFVQIAQAFGGVQVNMRIDAKSTLLLDKPGQLVVYRIIQELVQNALKHAKASEIKVELLQVERDLKVLVSDNGIGVNSQQNVAGQGFQTIKDRIKAMGADIRMDETAPSGLAVELLIHEAF